MKGHQKNSIGIDHSDNVSSTVCPHRIQSSVEHQPIENERKHSKENENCFADIWIILIFGYDMISVLQTKSIGNTH